MTTYSEIDDQPTPGAYRRWARRHRAGAMIAVPVAPALPLVWGGDLVGWLFIAMLLATVVAAIWPFGSLAAAALIVLMLAMLGEGSGNEAAGWFAVLLVLGVGPSVVVGATLGLLGRAGHHAAETWRRRQAQS